MSDVNTNPTPDPNQPTDPNQPPPAVPDAEAPVPAAPAGVPGQTAENTGGTEAVDTAPSDSGNKTPEEVAREVLAGHWGRGHRRAERLQLAGYDKAAVQHELNRLLGTEEFEGVVNEGVDNTQDTREQSQS
jgi:hypothetical protein